MAQPYLVRLDVERIRANLSAPPRRTWWEWLRRIEPEPQRDWTRDEVLAWLKEHARPGDVVVAMERTSNRIARSTPAAVVAGYRFSTVRFEEREEQLRRFYDGRTRDVSRMRMLKQYGVRYVVHGIEERESAYDPAASPFLVEAFRRGGGAVYQVRWP